MTAPDRPAWDPHQYLRHADHRTRPFHDLLARVGDLPGHPEPRIADLGCGAGNVTALLADRWPRARITGYDTSREMLAEAAAHARPGRTSTSSRPTPRPGSPPRRTT
ncbi:trans-aconitate 2-methyltransferase [Streptomyces californicus]